MTKKRHTRTQQDIETRAGEFRNQEPFPADSILEDLFGPPDEWTISVGPYRLMLIPVLWQWWVFDRVHEAWADTGYDMREVIFTVRDGELSPPPRARRRNAEKAGPGCGITTLFCTLCGNPLPDRCSFCTGCGAPAEPGGNGSPAAFCRHCGQKLTPKKAFCGGCGRRVQ